LFNLAVIKVRAFVLVTNSRV